MSFFHTVFCVFYAVFHTVFTSFRAIFNVDIFEKFNVFYRFQSR